MSNPQDRRYSATHQWALPQGDGSLLVGITDFAQSQLGDVMFVQLPSMGQVVSMDEPCALVESVKTASDVYAPVAGTILAVNSTLPETPEMLNSTPYESWFFKLRPDSPKSWDTLMTAEQYDAFIG
jgi:glycine cleavage system H protein